MSRWSWRRAAEAAAVLALLYFVGSYLVRHWGEVGAYPWRVAPLRLAAAALLSALSMAVGCWIWIGILRAMGERFQAREASLVYFASALARYVPGKVWQVSSLLYLARRRGIHALHALAAGLLLQLVVLAVGVLLFAGTLPAQAALIGGRGGGLVVAGAGLALVVLYLSPAFDRLYARLLRLLGRPVPLGRLAVAQKVVFGIGAIVLWLLWGAAFWLFLDATTGRTPPLPIALGISAAAYVGGYLAFFSPGGLGVRESLYAVLLAPWLPGSVALAAALLNRILLTLVELALTLLSAALAKRALQRAAVPETGLPLDG